MLSSTELSLGVRLANALVSYIRYIGKVLWPKDLAVIYPHPQHWPLWQVLGAAFLILLLSVLVLQAAKRCPWLLVGWFWFVGTLVPVIGLVQVGAQSIADRYTYLPSIGIFILVTWPLAEWAEGRGSRVERQDARTLARSYALTLLAIVALLTCAIATRAQIGVWQDTETLFTHALAATGEQNWVAHQNLALLAMERYHKSERSSIEHQRLDEVAGKAGTSGAPLSQTQDYLEAAIRHSAAAIKAKPRYPDAHVTLAKALMEQGKLDEAEEHLKTALALDRRQPEGSQNFAELLMRRGRLNEAIGQYRAALELKPDWDAGLNNLAWVLATASRSELRDGPEALRLAQRACSLTGRTNLWFLHTLAAAYANGGQFSEAIFTANEALRLATLTDNTNLIETAAARVALYQAGQPLRD